MTVPRYIRTVLLIALAASVLNIQSCTRTQKKQSADANVDFGRRLLQASIEIDCTEQRRRYRRRRKKELIREEVKPVSSFDQIQFDPTNRPNTIVVPPFTEYVLTIDSYCMKSSGAGPSQKEPYRVIKVQDNDIIKKLLDGLWKKCHDKHSVQSVIWNLTNRRHPRDLPESQQRMLVDSGVVSQQEVNVLPIERMMFKFWSWVFGTLIVNTLENYNMTETAIINRRSMFKLGRDIRLPQFHYRPFLIKLYRTYSYSRVQIGFYNYTGQAQLLRITDFQLKPKRRDVQPLSLELSRSRACNRAKKLKDKSGKP